MEEFTTERTSHTETRL